MQKFGSSPAWEVESEGSIVCAPLTAANYYHTHLREASLFSFACQPSCFGLNMFCAHQTIVSKKLKSQIINILMFREADCPETPRLEVSGTKLAMLSFQHQGKEKTSSMPENEITTCLLAGPSTPSQYSSKPEPILPPAVKMGHF